MSLWSIITPVESTNLVLNPSAEIAGNFSALGASCTVTRSASLAYRGVYSYKVDTDVAANSGIDLVTKAASNAIHYVSFRATSLGGVANLRVSMDNNAHYNNAALLFTDGTVLHYGVQIPAAEANGSTSLHIMQEAGAVKTFYIDAVQCEQLSTWTTYFDGDEPGSRWTGLPHGSASYRPENERSGGYVRDLVTTYGIKVQGETGFSSPTKESLMEPRALLDGAVWQGTRASGRRLQMVIHIDGRASLADFHSLKKAFYSAISRHLVAPQQPVTFWYSGAGKIVTLRAFVESGDEGGHMEGNYEKIVLNLMAVEDPYWEELIEQSAVVNNTTTLAVEQMVAWHHPDKREWNTTTGGWDALGAPELTGASAYIKCIAKDRSGNLYVGGNFTDLNGIANADYIAKRDVNGVWSALGTGTGGSVYAMACDAAGNVYVGGNFTNLTDANGDYISMWNGSAFVSLGTGANGVVTAIAIGPDGAVYAGGAFAAMGGVANTSLIAKWSAGSWSALGTGATGAGINAICMDLSGNLYAGGDFANAGGVATADYIAKWDGTTWTSVGVFNALVNAITVGRDGRVYATGNFATINSISIAGIAQYNGTTWSPLGSGLNGSGYSLAVTASGLVCVGGGFTSAGGVTVADRIAIWTGTTWVPLPIDLPGTPFVYALLTDGQDIYLGFDTEGNATIYGISASGVVASTATAPSYPIITINCAVAACTLQEVRNESTGSVIRFNRAMQIGETITIDCRPGLEQVRSDFPPPNGSQVSMLMPSDLGNFALKPGNNKVSVYAPGTGATVTVSLRWRVKHEGAEGGAT